MHGMLRFLPAVRTKISRDECVHAAAHADQKSGEKGHKNGRRADRTERACAGESSDDGNVGHIKQDL